ncbi:MAG: PASTA domain-containing protein [Bacteroidaceae bacterium]|nr:PASTA domain-containing protein [Bacteroidaceae bacterium]
MKRIIEFFKGHRIIANLTLMLIVAIMLFIGLNCWLHTYTRHDQATTVPSIKGITIEEADEILTRLNLRYEIIDSIHNDRKTPGIILEQIPAPESKIKEGRIVYITINAKTPRLIKVPNLINTSVRQAEAQLKSLGFRNVAIEYKNSPYKDLVLSIEYKGKEVSAGEKIPIADRIVIIVGSGTTSDETDASIGDSLRSEGNIIEQITDMFFQ